MIILVAPYGSDPDIPELWKPIGTVESLSLHVLGIDEIIGDEPMMVTGQNGRGTSFSVMLGEEPRHDDITITMLSPSGGGSSRRRQPTQEQS